MRHSGRKTLFAHHGHFIWLAKLLGSECDYNRSKIISNCYLLNFCFSVIFVCLYSNGDFKIYWLVHVHFHNCASHIAGFIMRGKDSYQNF